MNLSDEWPYEEFYVMKNQSCMTTKALQHAESYLKKRIDKIISRSDLSERESLPEFVHKINSQQRD
jgi:hypothetical protein